MCMFVNLYIPFKFDGMRRQKRITHKYTLWPWFNVAPPLPPPYRTPETEKKEEKKMKHA